MGGVKNVSFYWHNVCFILPWRYFGMSKVSQKWLFPGFILGENDPSQIMYKKLILSIVYHKTDLNELKSFFLFQPIHIMVSHHWAIQWDIQKKITFLHFLKCPKGVPIFMNVSTAEHSFHGTGISIFQVLNEESLH